MERKLTEGLPSRSDADELTERQRLLLLEKDMAILRPEVLGSEDAATPGIKRDLASHKRETRIGFGILVALSPTLQHWLAPLLKLAGF